MEQVQFKYMKDGTYEEYQFLHGLERQYITALPERILLALQQLDNTLTGYRVTRLEHSLQSATLAEDDGADEEMVLAALLHDIGDQLAPENHSQLAAAIIRPYVREEVTWIVAHHGAFQLYYYGHHLGMDRNARDKFRDHPWYAACVHFVENYDQAAFDPDYPTRPLRHFSPLVRRMFSREPFASEIIHPEAAETAP